MQDDTRHPKGPGDGDTPAGDLTLPLAADHGLTLSLGADGSGPQGERPEEDIGTVIGPYRLVERLGQGGMGEVFLAEQSEPIRRRVALKVIKQGMDTRAVVARFEAERQALALMDHPCIAKVLDAGATARGRPFFVMEYVDGEPVTDYCNRRNLGTRERLELFARVCEGVQHAHQKAVIHRDLKPSNILVAEVDGRPVPKIIDFGVAKATTQRLTELTMFTQLGQILGTPEYMSPEQAAASDDDIDTRTDVYALGVILYELLAGALPYEPRELRQAGYDAIRRIIIEQDPPRPSTRFGALGERATVVAEAHGTAPARLRGELRGDLDWITMKALEKDRNRRYETANGLAADVRRHLRSEPVVAGPPSRSYRLGKLVRRNRGVFVALGVIAVVMVAATVISSVMYTREQRASKLARREAMRSEQVSRFLGDMLNGVGPQVARGRDTALLKSILDDTEERLATELADEPEVEATLRLRLAHTYRQMNEWDQAAVEIERVKELQRTRDVKTPGVAAVSTAEGALAWNRGDIPGAEKLFRVALAATDGAAVVDSTAWAESCVQLGNVIAQTGRFDEADSLMQRALSVYRRHAPVSDGMAVNLNSLGNLDRYRGDLEAAEAHYREALALHRRVLGQDHPYIATDMHNLGRLLESRGRIAEAESLLLGSLAVLDKIYPGPHADKALTMSSVAEFYLNQQKPAKADSLAHAGLAMTIQLYGEDSDETRRAKTVVGELYQRSGRLDEALAWFRDLEPDLRTHAESDPFQLPDLLHRTGAVLTQMGRDREALPSFRESIDLYTKCHGADHPTTLLARNDYARALSNLGDDTTALTELQAVLETRERVLGPSHAETAITRADLGRTLWRMGRLEEAAASLLRGRDDFGAARGLDNPGRWSATIHYAVVLRDLGRLDEAEKELRACEEFFLKQGGEGALGTRATRLRLASVALKAGRPDECEQLLAKAVDPALGPVAAWLPGRAEVEAGNVLQQLGRFEEAAARLRRGYDLLLKATGPNGSDTQYAVRLLVKLYEGQGRAREAAAWRAKRA